MSIAMTKDYLNKKRLLNLTIDNIQKIYTIIIKRKGNKMTKKEIIKELREILKMYHYKSDEQHMSKDLVTSLENLLGSLLK